MYYDVHSPRDLDPEKALARICKMFEAQDAATPLSEEEQSAFERDFLVVFSNSVRILTMESKGLEKIDEWTLQIQRVMQILHQQYKTASDSPLFYFGQLAALFTCARQMRLRLMNFSSKEGAQ